MINKRERSRCKQTRHKQSRRKQTRHKQTRHKQTRRKHTRRKRSRCKQTRQFRGGATPTAITYTYPGWTGNYTYHIHNDLETMDVDELKKYKQLLDKDTIEVNRIIKIKEREKLDSRKLKQAEDRAAEQREPPIRIPPGTYSGLNTVGLGFDVQLGSIMSPPISGRIPIRRFLTVEEESKLITDIYRDGKTGDVIEKMNSMAVKLKFGKLFPILENSKVYTSERRIANAVNAIVRGSRVAPLVTSDIEKVKELYDAVVQYNTQQDGLTNLTDKQYENEEFITPMYTG